MRRQFLIFVLFLFLTPYAQGESKMKFQEPTEGLKGKYIAIIETSKGNIKVELYGDDAPISVANFVQLGKGKFYDGLTFHRVIANFMIQGGDPKGDGTGGPGYTTVAEIKLSHKKGALAWARLGGPQNPEKRSSGSQFYITHQATPHLDGDYTVFGQVIEGQDVVDKIQKGDSIKSIKILDNK